MRRHNVILHPTGRALTNEELVLYLVDASTPKSKVKGRRYAKMQHRKRLTERNKIPSRFVRFRESEEMLVESVYHLFQLDQLDRKAAYRGYQRLVDDGYPPKLIDRLLEDLEGRPDVEIDEWNPLELPRAYWPASEEGAVAPSAVTLASGEN